MEFARGIFRAIIPQNGHSRLSPYSACFGRNWSAGWSALWPHWRAVMSSAQYVIAGVSRKNLVLKCSSVADQLLYFLDGQNAGQAPLLARPRQVLHVPFLAKNVLVKLPHRRIIPLYRLPLLPAAITAQQITARFFLAEWAAKPSASRHSKNCLRAQLWLRSTIQSCNFWR